MSRKKELLKNTGIIAIGKCSTQILTFLLLPLYTTLLTTDEYGTYDFITTIALFIVPCITLLIEESMFRFLIDAKDEEDKQNIIIQAIIFIAINTTIISSILIIILNILKYEWTYFLISYIVALVINTLSQALCRGIGRIKLYSLSSFISSTITIVLNVIFIVIFKWGIKGLIIALIIANIVSATFVFTKIAIVKYLNLKRVSFNKTKEMIRYSIPLVPNSISWTIINLSDRLIITQVLGSSFNGIYAIANKFPGIINTFYGFFYTAWQESASKAIKEESYEEYYNSIYYVLKRFLFSITICLITSLPFIFNILINKSYENAYYMVPPLVISILFSNISGFYGGIFTAHKNTKVMGVTTLIAALTNITINLIFIAYIGVYAAVISTLISNLIVCIYRKYAIKKYIHLKKDTVFYYTSISILIIILSLYYLNNINLNIVSFIISILYSIIINKKFLLGILNNTKAKINF